MTKKSILKSTIYLAVAILVGTGIAYATSKLTPPETVSNTMYSLNDIYELATNGTEATEGTGDIQTTPSTIEETGKTLTEVYNAVSSAIQGAKGVLKTGQTHCNEFSDSYNASAQVPCTGTNQDGDLKRGLARSYTDNGDGTISDNTTGLMWQKCSASQTELDCSGEAAGGKAMDDGNGTSPAIEYCEDLSLATHTDWHLPSRFELESIIDLSKVSPAIDTTYFPNTQSDGYWSSTAYEDGTNVAWLVSFNDGGVSGGGMDISTFVRCVRE